MRANKKLLGVTVLPEFLQTEGIDAVLDNLTKAGVTAVTTSPYVMEPAEERTGVREPPDDAGAGNVRLLDRPLWVKRELFVKTAPSFEPDVRRYVGLRYQPAPVADLTRRAGAVIEQFIRAAQSRHLKVYLQVQAAIPPGYRVQFGGPVDDDLPQLPDGNTPARRVSKNGSLASPHILAYLTAMLSDLLRAYPDVDGIRLDWPEYPPYFLDEVFLDFGPHATTAGQRIGIDVERMRRDTVAVYDQLHRHLTNAQLEEIVDGDGGRFGLLQLFAEYPGFADLLKLKSTLSVELLASAKKAIVAAAGARVELVANAFAPPWTTFSGFDFGRVGGSCQGICTKLYTMHWAMMLNFYGMALGQANPRLDESKLVRALVKLLDLGDDDQRTKLADYAYPEPDKPHPVSDAAIARKVRQAERVAGATPVFALAHGYGPADDFRRRLQAAWIASTHGVWINRYGYLSDEKLAMVKDVCEAKS